MRDPYEVLGVSRSATQEQIKTAYRELAKKYHPDRFIDSPLAENANKRMQEINEAYDAIISGNRDGGSYSSPGYGSDSYNTYQQVKVFMQQNRLQEAEAVLENMDRNFRDAQWYYLKGQINYKRGWTDQAFTYFSMAYKMEPSNAEYRHAFENMNMQRNGGFRTAQGRNTHRSSGSNCDGCDICQGLICADCCCECMGGDLIPCC